MSGGAAAARSSALLASHRLLPTRLHPLYASQPYLPYDQGLELQRLAFERQLARRRDGRSPRPEVLLLEHAPTWTKGTTKEQAEHELANSADNKVIHKVNRGGQTTYHGPGQLVGYLIFDLDGGPPMRRDLHWLIRCVEESIIHTCASLGIQGATRRESKTGVWIGNAKIAAVGLGVSRWVTRHGFALNVEKAALQGFQDMTPCGIPSTEGSVACLSDFAQRELKIQEVVPVVQKSLETTFGLELREEPE